VHSTQRFPTSKIVTGEHRVNEVEDRCFTVIILCRNRPFYTRRALDSVLAQTRRPDWLFISDNSSASYARHIRTLAGDGINYIRQSGELTAREHIVRAAALVKIGFFSILHDDDILCRNYVFEMLKIIREFPDAVAYGSRNSWVNSSEKRINIVFPWASRTRKIDSSQSLISCYLSPSFRGAPAFSSYVYSAKLVDFERAMPNIQSEYYDTVFLANLIDLTGGYFIFSPKLLFLARLHSGRVSSRCGVADYKLFYKWATSKLSLESHLTALESYRLVNFRQAVLSKNGSKYSLRRKVLFWRVCAYFFLNPEFRAQFLLATLNHGLKMIQSLKKFGFS
jgi:glycosyltransferase involved in cell wall biosynthesis